MKESNCYIPNKKRKFSLIFTCFCCAAVFFLSLFMSDKISHSVKSGLSLCANVIIPSVFPFIVMSDFLYAFTDFGNMDRLGALFERIFKINRVGLYPFILGILCGFPLGVKCAAELYRDEKITKDEAERIIGFCNNTGPAFLVSGIGLGLRGNIYEGFILYFVMVFSAITVGFIFSIGSSFEPRKTSFSGSGTFSFTKSIKNAGINTLNICSYLTFFACVVGILKSFVGINIPYLFTIPFFEVGSATSILSKTNLISEELTLALSAFAVGFSGFSVHLQALSFLSDTDLSTKRYFLMKFMQGLISFALVLPLYSVFIKP